MGLLRMFAGKAPEVHEQKGDAYIQQRAYGDARLEFEKALDKIGKHFPEKSHLAQRLSEKLQAATEYLATDHIDNADLLAEAGDFEEAAELFRLAYDLTEKESIRQKVKDRIDDLRQKMAQGNDQIAEDIDLGHWDDNDDVEEDGEAMDADEAEIFGVLCHALPEETAEAYQRYGKAFKKGYIALNNGDFSLAVQELEQAMAENEGHITMIPMELATACMHLEQHARAREILEDYVRENPEEIRAYQLLCEIYWEGGELARADSLIRSAPQELQKSRAMLMLLGETRFQSSDYKSAQTVFLDYIDNHGKDEIVSRALAKTYEAAGEIERARDLYAEVMNKCVSCHKAVDPLLKRRFAELSFQTGEASPKLLELFFSLVQEDPQHRDAYYEKIGNIYEKQGEHKEARRYMDLAGQLK